MKKIICFFIGVLASLSLHASTTSQVTVRIAGQSAPVVMINNVDNLSQLVAHPKLQGEIWWPGTVIAERMATVAAQQQKQQVIARLTAWSQSLRADDDVEQAAVVESVVQQINAVRVTGRQFVTVDPDIVRIRPEANRRLVGDYSLWLSQKPTTVTVFGAIANSGKTTWQPGRDTADYLAMHPRLAGAERNVVQVIDVSGKVTDVPVAYWNHHNYEAPLGSVVYVGFSSWALPRAYHDLNQQIISVLTHRVPD